MSRALAVLLAAGAGCFVGLQAPVNARLEPILRDIADDFIAKPVPRHG